jgi:hypothetical protein
MNDRYKYAEEKFSQARRDLMLPPPGKEAQVISEALNECWLGLRDLSLDDLDNIARDYVFRLNELIERKENLSKADERHLCESIDYLAYYFHDRWTEVWN